MNEVSIFDGFIPYYKITKPVKLIELFAGIGSQHQALKNLGVNIVHSTIVEWQVNSIQAYNDIHVRKYDDWTQGLTKEEIAFRLNQLGVSLDYNEPAKLETLLRKGEEWLRNVYNNIINTNNKVNIMSVKAEHLNITETNKYDYILTYSFPCQDLSKAGKGKGMSDTNTRSGLLWEVERILSECNELPQVLLMENVPDVIGSRYIQDFKRWDERLRQLGYSNHIEVLNAKDYGIPQNRERAFMISILGDYQYRFPQPIPLKLRLKDMLEKEVDEKYYLSDKVLNVFKSQDKRLPEMLDKIDYNSNEPQSLDLYNRTVSDISQTLTMPNHNSQAIVVPEDTNLGFALAYEGDGVYINRPEQKRGVVQKQMIQTIKTQNNDVGVVVVGNYSPSNHNATNIVSPNGISPIVMENHGSVTAVVETKEYANYITWEDDKGRLNTQDHRAYFEDRLSGTIPAMERGVPNVLLNSNDVGVVVNEPKLMIDGNIQANGRENGNIYNQDGLSPTLLARDYKDPKKVNNNLRIRKLTPRECYRLMGFSDQAFDLAQPNQSNSSLYHQAGDSIVVNVLMALFGSLING
jgi:DNA (cytosine-5)-methyltransferase 1